MNLYVFTILMSFVIIFGLTQIMIYIDGTNVNNYTTKGEEVLEQR